MLSNVSLSCVLAESRCKYVLNNCFICSARSLDKVGGFASGATIVPISRTPEELFGTFKAFAPYVPLTGVGASEEVADALKEMKVSGSVKVGSALVFRLFLLSSKDYPEPHDSSLRMVKSIN